jgi:hypothetical protein
LISGVLVFSVTFSKEIIDFDSAMWFQKLAVGTAWLAWIAAVICVGLGILINFVAAVQALRRHERNIRRLVWLTFGAIDAGGVLFVAGLLALALSAVTKLL